MTAGGNSAFGAHNYSGDDPSATKSFLDDGAIAATLPLKDGFFLLKLDLLSLQISKLICNDHRSKALTYIRHMVSIGPDNALWAK